MKSKWVSFVEGTDGGNRYKPPSLPWAYAKGVSTTAGQWVWNGEFYQIPKENKMETHWICYVEGTDGGKHFKHPSLESAEKEAERLARLLGKSVSIYEWKGTCQVNRPPVLWDIPEHRNFGIR